MSLIDSNTVYTRALSKKIEPQRQLGDAESGNSENSQDYQELHPGLAKVFGQRGRNKLSKKQQATGDRIAADFEKTEAVDEGKAKERGDDVAQDSHHYRREILSQIRRVYADANASEPKKYSYTEWAYFLKLLGEDEADSRFHKRAPVAPKAGENPTADQTVAISAPGQSDVHKDERQITPWSWLGQTSPLMDDKDEPEWILERLFARLEQSMKDQLQEAGQSNGRKPSTIDNKDQNVASDQDTLQSTPDETKDKDV